MEFQQMEEEAHKESEREEMIKEIRSVLFSPRKMYNVANPGRLSRRLLESKIKP
jgi:hypothetical protein